MRCRLLRYRSVGTPLPILGRIKGYQTVQTPQTMAMAGLMDLGKMETEGERYVISCLIKLRVFPNSDLSVF